MRNLRYYQERGLLPPPRREGRIAWCSDDHLTRLRLISDLLGRGYTVNGIGELPAAWEQGGGVVPTPRLRAGADQGLGPGGAGHHDPGRAARAVRPAGERRTHPTGRAVGLRTPGRGPGHLSEPAAAGGHGGAGAPRGAPGGDPGRRGLRTGSGGGGGPVRRTVPAARDRDRGAGATFGHRSGSHS
ncbi:MerR family transcriptional regulator [Streptomyces sp. NPDC087917]|uniref:MerR family transcriptional regulator n=1 Tax=Streptomyces sp. NPDC087917 TaxID=3155060 RepID=UPI00342E6459